MASDLAVKLWDIYPTDTIAQMFKYIYGIGLLWHYLLQWKIEGHLNVLTIGNSLNKLE